MNFENKDAASKESLTDTPAKSYNEKDKSLDRKASGEQTSPSQIQSADQSKIEKTNNAGKSNTHEHADGPKASADKVEEHSKGSCCH